MSTRRILLAVPHGFCSGVFRAVEAAEETIRRFPPPVYCLNEIVHNQQVVRSLADRGMVFVKNVDEVPDDATLLFSAHGVSPEIRRRATGRLRRVIDATCPFVLKVHAEVARFAAEGLTVLIIGRRGHDEVIGLAGEGPGRVIVVENEDEAARVKPRDPARVGVVMQTTLNPDATRDIMAILHARFPHLRMPEKSDICYATRNRQQAVRKLAEQSETVLVLGSKNSSNSRRLVEVAAAAGCRAELIDDRSVLRDLALDKVLTLGITSGASTPESYLDEVLQDLAVLGFKTVTELVVGDTEEPGHFGLPTGLLANPGGGVV